MANISMLNRLHKNNNATFVELANNALVVAQYQDLSKEKEQLTKLGLIDLSAVARIGFKGSDTPEWLSAQGIALPNNPNQAKRLDDATLVAKLSTNEYLFLSDVTTNNSKVCEQLKFWQIEDNKLCYLLPRDQSHSWFLLTGKHTIQMMSKICGVDLADKATPHHGVVQSSVARVNHIIIKDNIANTECIHLLSDSTFAEYMWFCLLDAMQEFCGKAIGVNALK